MRPGRAPRRLASVATATAAIFWLGCGGGGADIAAPELGTLEVTTTTSGPEPDANGYAISIDGAPATAVAPNATFQEGGVAAGSHTVELSGLAANCTVSGALRLDVTVTANAVSTAAFAVACVPTTGTIQVTTVAGTPADPDGYALILDGVEVQAIATATTVSITSVSPGAHTLGLGGVAEGCQVDGEDVVTVTVVAGQTAAATIGVTCTPPPPESGTLAITTETSGPEQDPDGYSYSVDAGDAHAIGESATANILGLAAGPHIITLAGVSANCAVGGNNPRTVTVTPGGTARTTFGVTCAATTGNLTVTIAGLPAGTDAAVTVTGPDGYSQQLTATQTLSGLVRGSYTVTAVDVTSGSTKYTASPATRTISVPAAGTASVTVSYTVPAAPTLDLHIDGWELSQSVQTPDGDVPLVANREGYLRIFVVSNERNSVAPSVRVRLYSNGALASTLTVPAPGASTPLRRDEGKLASSWNVKIPRELIGRGLAVLADVDPDNTIAEKDETNNSSPGSGTPRVQDVRDASVLGITFVPVKQQANGLQGDVSDANRSSFLDLVRKIYPLPGTDGDAHKVYTTTTNGALQPDDANGAWVTVLGEIDLLRITEGTPRTYYGVVRIDYPSGIAGLGYLGTPTAIGYDREPDKTRVSAHELGHTFNRLHSPCGNPADVDPAYPYRGGSIGVYGVDLQTGVLKNPSFPDIMGYCGDPWISDYTYKGVQAFRAAAGSVAAAAAAAQRCLLVWGRIVDGRAVLEPAFEVVTRPSLPKQPGPYTLEGVTAGGARLFSLSFDATAVADDPHRSRHFAFAVPVGNAPAGVESLRLDGPGGAAGLSRLHVPAAAAATQDLVQARRTAGGAALQWDARAHPMIMVRDPDTGEVLSFARGGSVDISTDKSELDVILSDQVGSRQMRVAVTR